MINKYILQLLDQYATELKVAPPKFNVEARCKIIINSIPILLEAPEDQNEVLLLSVVYDGPPTLEIMSEALSGNLYWLETGGCTLMWDKDHQTLLLCSHFNPEYIQIQTLKNILLNFADNTKAWQVRLEKVRV